LYETFKDRSAYLGNSFVAVGNAEFSNKMASYTTDQKVFTKTSHPTGGSCVGVEYSVRVASSRDAAHRAVIQLEGTGSER
jgi:hypothetical protein